MRRIAFGAAMIFVLVSPLRASADVVELKTGETVQGVLKEVNGTKVVIEVGGQSIAFDRAKVRAFSVGTPPQGAGVPGASPGAVEEALAALKGLQSALSAGVSYRDYGPRVADTKARVDRAAESPSVSPKAKLLLKQAIAYYILANEAWQGKIQTRGSVTLISDSNDALIDACPKGRQFMSQYAERYGTKPYYAIGFGRRDGETVVETSLQVFWGCASEKIMEAETALRVEADPTTGPAWPPVVSVPPPPSSTKPPTSSQTTPPTPGATMPGGSQVVGTIGITMAMGSEPTPSYLGQIKMTFWGKWSPPADDVRRNLVAVVMVTLDRDGRIKGAMLEKTSGSTKFDEVAVRAVIDAQRGPALPRDRPEESVVVRATFSR